MRKSRLTFWAFLTPALVFFGLGVVFPLANAAWLSLHAWDGAQAADGAALKTWVGVANYIELLGDRRFAKSLENNVSWLVLYLLALPLGLAMALFLHQTMFGMRLYRSFYFLPFVVSQVVIGFMFSWLYDPRNGLISKVWGLFGSNPPAILGDPDLVTFGLIAAGLWPQVAYCAIIYLTGLTTLSQDQNEAARLDGAKGLRMLRYIVLPQLKSATFIAFLVTVIGALRAFDLVAVMTGGGPFGSSRILAYFMFEQALSEYGVRKGYGAAIAMVLFALTLVLMSYFLWRVYRDDQEAI